MLEIGLVPAGASKQYPGIFIWSTCARMMRPVRNLSTGETEYIGSFEQVHHLFSLLLLPV